MLTNSERQTIYSIQSEVRENYVINWSWKPGATPVDEMTFCMRVSHHISKQLKFRQVIGEYVGPDASISVLLHAWNLLDDGTIIDATALQFKGEKESIREIKGDDYRFGRYRAIP